MVCSKPNLFFSIVLYYRQKNLIRVELKKKIPFSMFYKHIKTYPTYNISLSHFTVKTFIPRQR